MANCRRMNTDLLESAEAEAVSAVVAAEAVSAAL